MVRGVLTTLLRLPPHIPIKFLLATTFMIRGSGMAAATAQSPVADNQTDCQTGKGKNEQNQNQAEQFHWFSSARNILNAGL